jgi:hypothetical protein
LLFSDKYPAKIVSPDMVSCYVVDRISDKTYYYPISRLQLEGKDYGSNGFRIHINTYSYCQSPVGVKTLFTAADLLKYKDVEYYVWYCPELGRNLYPANYWREQGGFDHLLKEGVLLFV